MLGINVDYTSWFKTIQTIKLCLKLYSMLMVFYPCLFVLTTIHVELPVCLFFFPGSLFSAEL